MKTRLIGLAAALALWSGGASAAASKTPPSAAATGHLKFGSKRIPEGSELHKLVLKYHSPEDDLVAAPKKRGKSRSALKLPARDHEDSSPLPVWFRLFLRETFKLSAEAGPYQYPDAAGPLLEWMLRHPSLKSSAGATGPAGKVTNELSVSTSGEVNSETHIAIDPNSPKNIVGGSNNLGGSGRVGSGSSTPLMAVRPGSAPSSRCSRTSGSPATPRRPSRATAPSGSRASPSPISWCRAPPETRWASSSTNRPTMARPGRSPRRSRRRRPTTAR